MVRYCNSLLYLLSVFLISLLGGVPLASHLGEVGAIRRTARRNYYWAARARQERITLRYQIQCEIALLVRNAPWSTVFDLNCPILAYAEACAGP